MYMIMSACTLQKPGPHSSWIKITYMVTFTINIPQMLAYIPYTDPMGYFTERSLETPPGATPAGNEMQWSCWIWRMCIRISVEFQRSGIQRPLDLCPRKNLAASSTAWTRERSAHDEGATAQSSCLGTQKKMLWWLIGPKSVDFEIFAHSSTKLNHIEPH